ncbi:MAG: hypothetical protein KA319_05110 [Ferruginibacter sp.]|nr:hypothetical protein [Ferruginibacter sp.]
MKNKKLLLLLAQVFLSLLLFAQQQTFDITNYIAPKGWKKQGTENSVQFSTEDAAKGTYCIIMLLKAIPGMPDSKENFKAAWETVVKDAVTVSAPPEMQAPAKEDGWEALSGFAPFESEGNKGIALLVTSTGFQKMVNILILTNTDVYQNEMSAFLESVSFKKIVTPSNKPQTNPNKANQANTFAKKDGYAFTTTNFDDGWNSTVQEDWVEVTKGNIKVLIHYPKEGTIFPADPEPLTNAAWNILVAPRYSTLRNYKTSYITTYDRPYLGMGYATEKSSGKEVFVLLFRQGSSGWLEFVAPDKNSFIQQYRFDPETIRWDSESDLLKPLVAMVNYNKFAVAASDFKGTWTSDFTGVQQLYHVYTGNYAGMNINQSNEEFVFGAGSSYNWRLLVVNGMVGAMKYANVKSAGKFSVLNNWQIKFSDIEGKPKTYNAFFSCIKGARLLQLLDAQYPGSGVYTVFGKK